LFRQRDVTNLVSWRAWAQQELGTPFLRRKGKMRAGEFVEEHDLPTLVRLTLFCKEHNFGRAMKTVDSVPLFYEQAVQAGWFYELNRSDSELQLLVDSAIYEEDDPVWVRRLLSATGEARKLVYDNWRTQRAV
jgi:hypothetical protein